MIALAILVGALLGHLALRACARRAAVALARRRPPRGTGGPAAVLVWRERLTLALLPAWVALWVAALLVASEYDAGAMRLRHAAASALSMAASAPLFRLAEMPYTAVDVLLLPVLLIALWLVLGGLSRLLGTRVGRLLGASSGVSETVALVARYAFALLGSIVILQAWGVDVASLALAAGVLGVGIGFGLQRIASDFVSGVLIGIERPISPGDFVEVGAHQGTVQHIGARSTSIETLDRVTIVVPNSQFLEREVVNWSHGDPTSRLHVPVSVDYPADIALVRAALFESAFSHPEVLNDPRPRIELRGFGNGSLDFELLVWTREPRSQSRVSSELYFRIEENLRAHGIELAQSELKLPRELLGLARAFARQQLGAEEVEAALRENARPLGHGHEDDARWEAFDSAVGRREWDDAALAELVERMRAPGGVEIADRRHLLRTYTRCFVGKEAVDWLVRNEALTREQALEAGRLLVRHGLVRHVLDEHGFEDAQLFYRFAADSGA